MERLNNNKKKKLEKELMDTDLHSQAHDSTNFTINVPIKYWPSLYPESVLERQGTEVVRTAATLGALEERENNY